MTLVKSILITIISVSVTFAEGEPSTTRGHLREDKLQNLIIPITVQITTILIGTTKDSFRSFLINDICVV